jgi:hypothetical protein
MSAPAAAVHAIRAPDGLGSRGRLVPRSRARETPNTTYERSISRDATVRGEGTPSSVHEQD